MPLNWLLIKLLIKNLRIKVILLMDIQILRTCGRILVNWCQIVNTVQKRNDFYNLVSLIVILVSTFNGLIELTESSFYSSYFKCRRSAITWYFSTISCFDYNSVWTISLNFGTNPDFLKIAWWIASGVHSLRRYL